MTFDIVAEFWRDGRKVGEYAINHSELQAIAWRLKQTYEEHECFLVQDLRHLLEFETVTYRLKGVGA